VLPAVGSEVEGRVATAGAWSAGERRIGRCVPDGRSAPLTVIVPVFNEGRNLRAWWEAAQSHLPSGTQIRLVYDGDEDDTLPVAGALAKAGAPISAIRNARRGVLFAIRTGLASVEAGPVLVAMADLSDDFSLVPAMLGAYRAGADVVVASRYARGGRQLGGPWLKGQLARWGGRSLKWLAGFPVSDATNSFRLYDAAMVRGMRLESRGGFEVGFEITLQAWRSGRSVSEIPCTWRGRTVGTSRFRLIHWLPRYARLWAAAMRHGALRRVGAPMRGPGAR
jgi:dolichol-phosphate mannosyltransferase